MIESLERISLNQRSSVGTLLSLSINFVVDNLAFYANGNMELLQILPYHLKNRILQRFTTSSYFWRNVDFKIILSAIVNDKTLAINLTALVVDDEMLEILRNCKSIRRVYLSTRNGNLMTTNGLLNLLRYTKELYILLVAYCDKIDDNVLECLANNCPNLMGLDIRGCENVTDIGIKYLSKLRNLTWVTFSHTQTRREWFGELGKIFDELQISDEGLLCLVEGDSGKKIKELRIENCSNVTEIGLDAIAKNCPNIEVLMFHNCSLPDSGIVPSLHAAQLKHLKQLTWTFSW